MRNPGDRRPPPVEGSLGHPPSTSSPLRSACFARSLPGTGWSSDLIVHVGYERALFELPFPRDVILLGAALLNLLLVMISFLTKPAASGGSFLGDRVSVGWSYGNYQSDREGSASSPRSSRLRQCCSTESSSRACPAHELTSQAAESQGGRRALPGFRDLFSTRG